MPKKMWDGLMWDELSGFQRGAIVLSGADQLGLPVAALGDIYRRAGRSGAESGCGSRRRLSTSPAPSLTPCSGESGRKVASGGRMIDR